MARHNDMPMTQLPVELFTYYAPERRLHIEVSDLLGHLHRPAASALPLERIFNDACDAGLAIRGRREVRRFAFVRTVEGPDEVVGWELAEIDARGSSVQGGITLFVVND